MKAVSDAKILEQIRRLLSDGLKTTTAPVPEDSSQYEKIVNELRDLDGNDLKSKLIIAGFLEHSMDDMRCLECMYYKPHRQWCALPELDLPVAPDWWCRLWRI